MRRSHAILWALLLLPTAGLALAWPAREPGASEPPAAAARAAGDLEAALAAVRADNIRADMHFIASDEMGGRDTPSPGLKVAARYIRARLQRLGLQPGARDGYFHYYPLRLLRLDEDQSRVELAAGDERVALTYAEDYFLASPSEVANVSTAGDVVFCGTGEVGDFEGLELEGRWALCADSGISPLKRRNNARRAGAAGLLVMPASGSGVADYGIKFASVIQRSRQGLVSWPSSSDRGPRTVFPQVYLARPAAERLLALAGRAGGQLSPGESLAVRVSEERHGEGTVQMENVCGFWPGSDPRLKDEVILVSAHYDHVGTRGSDIYNGADDNGSGTTGLLALAEALVNYGPMRRSVMLIWVSAEERGLWGSKAWSRDPWLPGDARPVANVNIDMIGRNAPDKLQITPTRRRKDDYNGIVKAAERLCELEGFDGLGSADSYYHRSDQAEFARLGIPVAFLFADIHEDYHEPSDTADKIDYDKIRRVTRLVMRMLDELQAGELAQ